MIYLTYKQAKELVEQFGGDEETVLSIHNGTGHSGDGIYVGCAGYPEEGASYLGQEPTP